MPRIKRGLNNYKKPIITLILQEDFYQYFR